MTEEEKQLVQMTTTILQELCKSSYVQRLIDAMGYDVRKLLYYNKQLHLLACEKCGEEGNRHDAEEDPLTWYNQITEKSTKKEESSEWIRKLLNDMDKLDTL